MQMTPPSSAVGTLYSQLSPISFSEFTPSRVTRVSNNPFLQEHSPFSSKSNNFVTTTTASAAPPNQQQRISFHPPTTVSTTTTTANSLSGKKYVQLLFDAAGSQQEEEQRDVVYGSVEDYYSTIRRYQRPTDKLFQPESVLGFTAVDEEEDSSETDSRTVIRQSLTATKTEHMDRPISFAIAIEENPISIFDIAGSPPTSCTTGAERTSLLPTDSPIHDQDKSSQVNDSRDSMYHNISGPGPSSRPQVLPINDPMSHDDGIPLSSIGYYNIPTPNIAPSYRRSSSDTVSYGSPQHQISSSLNDVDIQMIRRPFPLSSTDNTHCSINSCSMEDLLSDGQKLQQRVHTSSCCSTSTPNLLQLTDSNKQAIDESYGRFTVVYLGKMETDCFTNCIDKCAKKMLDPKSPVPVHSSEVIVDIMSSRVRLLKPTSGMLLISIPVGDLFTSSQCSKNKRLVGIIVWKKNSVVPVCHLFRCGDQPLSNAFLDSLTSVKQDADWIQMGKLSQQQVSNEASRAGGDNTRSLSVSLSDSSVGDVLHKWPAIHIAIVKVTKSLVSVSSIIKKALSDYRPSQSINVSIWVSLAQIRLVQMMDKKRVMYGQHSIRFMEAIGTDNNDQRLVGYIINEKDKPPIAYIVLCYSLADAGALVNFLREACQNDYQLRSGGGGNGGHSMYDIDHGTNRRSVTGGGILSLFRSMKPVRSNNTVSEQGVVGSQTVSPSNTNSSTSLSSSFQSYVSSQQITSSMVSDVPQKRKNCVVQPSPLRSSFDSAEEDFAKFTVTYVGSANLEGPFSPTLVSEALIIFKEGGVAAGMAPISKNSVTMHVSALGINLSDRKQKMFINRNYPKKQIVGYSSLPIDPQYFGFGTLRPGFKDQLKVHVFMSCDLPTEQILYAMEYWLNLTPTK